VKRKRDTFRRVWPPLPQYVRVVSKGKEIPLQAWTGPEVSRRLRVPDLKTIGRVYPQEIFLVLSSFRGWGQPQAHSAAGRIMSMENSSDTIGNRTRDLPAFSAVPQPTAPPLTPLEWLVLFVILCFAIIIIIIVIIINICWGKWDRIPFLYFAAATDRDVK